MNVYKRISLALTSVLVLVVASCKTESYSGAKDLVQVETSDGGLSAQLLVYYADAVNVYRASCPMAQQTVGNYRQFCPTAQSVSIGKFQQNIRTAYQNTYRQPMSATHEAILTQMIQFMANPQATWDSSQFGPVGMQLASLFPLAIADQRGTVDGSTGGTPIPGPSGNRIAGPVQVNIPFGQTIAVVNVSGLGERTLPAIKFELSQNCPFVVKGVLAYNNDLQSTTYDYSVAQDQWIIQQNIKIDAMMVSLEGGSGVCNLALNSGNAGGAIGGGVNPNDIPDGDAYYMTLIGYQRQSLIGSTFDPKSAHTFATYAQVRKQGQQVQVVREDTISWLPRGNNGEVVVNTPVPGVNWSLAHSIQKGSQRGLQMLRWGPFPISKVLYDKVLARKAIVDQWANYGTQRAAVNPRFYSGNAVFGNLRLFEDGIYYIAIDPSLRGGTLENPPRGANNCFHAVGDVLSSSSQDWLVNGAARGWKATDQTLEYYLLQAGREFIDYPSSNLAGYVRKYQPIAQAWGLGGISHTGALPSMPQQTIPVGAAPAALPANWGTGGGMVN